MTICVLIHYNIYLYLDLNNMFRQRHPFYCKIIISKNVNRKDFN